PVIFCAFVWASCVPNRKVTLLQNQDLYPKNIVHDTVVRSYEPEQFDYRVQPNDLLSIRFESITQQEFDFLSAPPTVNPNANVNALSAQLIGELVDQDGMVPFPVIGKVKVAGLTVFQIQDTLQVIANRYLNSPTVKVRLLNYRFTILGEAAR